MIPRSILMVLAVSWCLTPASYAQRRPQREFKSENEKFVLRVKPGRAGHRAKAACSATLLGRKGGRKSIRWERPLVNQIAPMLAVVRDDGRFVVTLGEFPFGGVYNALVIYGDKGQLLRHFLLTDLLKRDDWAHVKSRGKRIEWLKDVETAFESEPELFVIRLHWDREVRIDLKTLQIVRERDGVAAAESGIPPEILAALAAGQGTADFDRAAVDELVASGEMSEEEAAPLIAEGGDSETESDEPESDATRIEARSLDEALRKYKEAFGREPPQEVVDMLTGVFAQGDEVKIAFSVGHAREPEGEVGGGAAEEVDAPVEPAEPSHVAGRILGEDMPEPNVAEPTDYLSWINSFSATEGPSAAPFYQAAVDNYAEFEGDAELYAAAMKGDPDALDSPQVQAWLDANQAAIADFRAGNEFEYNGLELQSEKGDLIGALLPHLSKYRLLTRALVTEGRSMLADGDATGAVDAYVDAITAGQQAARGQTLIDSLVGTAMQAAGSEALLDAFESAGDDLDYSQLATRMAEAHRPMRPLTELAQFERSMFMDTAQRVFEMDPASGKPVVTRQSLQRFDVTTFTGDPDAAGDMREQFLGLDFDQTRQAADAFYDSVTGALELPFPQQRAAFAEIEQGLQTQTNPMLKVMLPSLSRVSFVTARGQARQRGAELVANIKAYQQQHGGLPDSLEAFGDHNFTIDPFTGGRFRYVRDGDGFRVYSAGGNGTDDGGIDDPSGEESDLVIWPRIKHDN